MKKRITLTLDFDSDDIFNVNHLFDAALFLNGIDFALVFDCSSAKISISGLPPEYEELLTHKVYEREVIINE